MTTSGVTLWSLTALDVVSEALRENAIIGIDEVPDAAMAAKCLVRLNGLLKSWCIGSHLEATGTITVTGGQASGVIDASIKEVRAARVVESATYERQLARWERDEYFRIPNKAASGSPTCFYADAQRDATVLYVWPVPAANTTLKVEYQRFPETVTDLSETVDIPDEYQEAIYANLAVRCAGMFGVQPAPELVARAAMLKREMEDAERPASYFMEAYE